MVFYISINLLVSVVSWSAQASIERSIFYDPQTAHMPNETRKRSSEQQQKTPAPKRRQITKSISYAINCSQRAPTWQRKRNVLYRLTFVLCARTPARRRTVPEVSTYAHRRCLTVLEGRLWPRDRERERGPISRTKRKSPTVRPLWGFSLIFPLPTPKPHHPEAGH